MPFDEDAEADNPGFRPPPHPDDRLWRHPSEMDVHPIVPLGAPARRHPMETPTAQGDRPRRRPWVVAVLAGSVGAVLASVGVVALGLGDRVEERPVTERATLDREASAPGSPDPAADSVRARVAPAVVGVGVGSGVDDSAPGRVAVAGSGLIVRDDGIVVTSAALVPATTEPAVRLPDGTAVAAEVVGADPATGLAVLDLAGGGDHTVGVLADAAGMATGETALAVNALGDRGTDAAPGLAGSTLRFVGPTGTALDGVEIDGEADPLALGGPVVDERGAVVGIVTAIGDGASWYVAPVEVVQRVVDEVLTTGEVHHVWLGIEGADVAPVSDVPGTLSAAAPVNGGIEVASVVPGGPADDGGLHPGDVIVALDGQAVTHLPDLFVGLRSRSPGDHVDVTVTRDGGARATLAVTLGAAPAPAGG